VIVDRPTQIRVLHVIPGNPEGIEFVFAKRQVAFLQRGGVAVRTFFLPSRTSLLQLLRHAVRFRCEIKEFRPHIIHAQFGTMTAFFCACATRLPVVVTFRGSDLNPSPHISVVRSILGRLLSQLAALRAEYSICVTGRLKAQLWWRKHRARVVPSGVDLDMFCPSSKQAARTKLGWSQTDRIVLFNNAGQYPKIKRLDLAEEAVLAAQLQIDHLRLVVMQGEIAPETMPTYLNAVDCLLVTSDWEGSPNIVKEAMACNLPVVSVDVGDVAERLEGVDPSRIADREVADLAAAMAAIVGTGARSNGRERLRQLSQQAVAEQICSIYDLIMQKMQAETLPSSDRANCRPGVSD